MENKQIKKVLTDKVSDIREFIDNNLMNENDTYQEASCKSFIYDYLDQFQNQVNRLIIDN